jgi:hypothetical protein
MPTMAPEEKNPLYSTTFTLHRLSPLYTGSQYALTNDSLVQYARSFRDILAGEVLRGVRVGLGYDDDALARAGGLQTVNWSLLVEDENSQDSYDLLDSHDTVDRGCANQGFRWGIHIAINYEKVAYTGILLQQQNASESEPTVMEDGFQNFPLLLTRMPGALRETLIEFISATFDTRISKLQIAKNVMINTLEDYIEDCSITGDGDVQTSRAIADVLKDVQIVIGFEGLHELTSFEILVDKGDLPRLAETGKRMVRGGPVKMPPFSTALSKYINSHMALDTAHDQVKILRIACGAFVLGADGRIKLTEPQGDNGVWYRATDNLVSQLINLAQTGIRRPAAG